MQSCFHKPKQIADLEWLIKHTVISLLDFLYKFLMVIVIWGRTNW